MLVYDLFFKLNKSCMEKESVVVCWIK